MSLDKSDDLNQDTVVTKKKKMTVDQFFQQFNTLDMNNYGSWPLSVKITCWIFIFLAVAALGYFLVIKSQLESIANEQAKEQSLLNEFKEKDSKLRNLQQYQVQLQEMEANFNQQLEQLPKETEIPSLVEDINLTGVNSGLKFKNIRLRMRLSKSSLLNSQSVFDATGDYHAFGSFVTGIAALPRIVTLHDFTVEAKEDTQKKSDIPVVNYTVKAKTYRYVGTDDQANNAAGAPATQTATTPPAQGGK